MSDEILHLLQGVEADYNPLVELLMISREEEADVSEKIACHKEIAKYCYSQKKAVESKVDLNGELAALRIVIDTDGEESDLSYSPPSIT